MLARRPGHARGAQRERANGRRCAWDAPGPRRAWDSASRRRKRRPILRRITPAERLLQELGITEPKEIDLEAIAFHLGARVRFRRLEGCEARIIGRNDAAIITIGEGCTPGRKRFSLAHEIGHWTHHRGQTLVCRVEESRPNDSMSPERVANTLRLIF